jgi:hypothetical protein
VFCQCLPGKRPGTMSCAHHRTDPQASLVCVATLQHVVGPEGQPLLPSKLRYCHCFTIYYIPHELVLGGSVIRFLTSKANILSLLDVLFG